MTRYDEVSRTYILLDNGPKLFKFWLDEDKLDHGRVVAPDGSGEQCPGCGTDLGEANVLENLQGKKVECVECGSLYPVLVKP